LYFSPGDATALATQLERVLSSPELARSLRENGRRRVSRLSWDTGAKRLRELISEAAGD
jgi:glycosyltransferase involved in cell wall biosynthesis